MGRARNNKPCPICGKTVKYASDVARHNLLHAPNKDALRTRCPWPGCKYGALQRNNLRIHIRKHGCNVYLCPQPTCRFAALDPASVKLHEESGNCIPLEAKKRDLANDNKPKRSRRPRARRNTRARSSTSPPPESEAPRTPDDLPQQADPPTCTASEVPRTPDDWPQQAGPFIGTASEVPHTSANDLQQRPQGSYAHNAAPGMPNFGTMPPNAPTHPVVNSAYAHGFCPGVENNQGTLPVWLMDSHGRIIMSLNGHQYYQVQQGQQHHQQQQPVLSSWDYSSQASFSFPHQGDAFGTSLGGFQTWAQDDFGVPLDPFYNNAGSSIGSHAWPAFTQ